MLQKYEEAVDSYSKALSQDSCARVWFERGIDLDKLGLPSEAIKSYDKAIKENLNFSAALYAKASNLEKMERYTEALATYDQLLELHPESADVWYHKGTVLDKLGNYEEAIFAYEQALSINPDYPEANFRIIVDNNLIIADNATRNMDRMQTDQATMIQIFKGAVLSPISNTKVPESIIKSNRDDSVLQSEAFDVDCIDVWDAKGISYQSIGKYDEAIACYDKALMLDPTSAVVLCDKGSALADSGMDLSAIECYESAVSFDPGYSPAWYALGVMSFTTGDSERALIMCFLLTRRIFLL
jgi:tetratricopeptide (TPR) repeat protein